MAGMDDWKKDPLVLVQQDILPVPVLAQSILLQIATVGRVADGWGDAFHAADAMLRYKGGNLMRAYGVVVSAQDQRAFDAAADTVMRSKAMLAQVMAGPNKNDAIATAHAAVQDDLYPALNEAIDHFRRLFISLVIARQKTHAEQSRAAISGLDRISKQIFFISLNASVEAARVGDAGRGFLQISTDIRALSQSAQDATRGLSDLVAENSGG